MSTAGGSVKRASEENMWESTRAWVGGEVRACGILPGIWSETVETFFEEPMSHGGLVATRVEASITFASRRAGASESEWWG